MKSLLLCALRIQLIAAVLGFLGCSTNSAPSADVGDTPPSSDTNTDTTFSTDTVPNDETDARGDTSSNATEPETDTGTEGTDDSKADAGPNGKDAGPGEMDTNADSEIETDTDTEANAGTDTESTSTAEDPVERTCMQNCMDFPNTPILEAALSPSEISLFGDKDIFETPGPCVTEPQLSEGDMPGALFPADWLRPRFRFTPQGDDNLFEIRLQADRQAYDLIVYTRDTTWVMPDEIWKGLTHSVIDEPITVTIRGINIAAPKVPSGTRGTFQIAPVKAGGKIVYWATSSARVAPDAGKLSVFSVGEDTVNDALTVEDVGDRDLLTPDGTKERPAAYGVGQGCVQCIGCHTVVPDGKSVAFGDHWPWNVLVSSIDTSKDAEVPLGAAPAYMSDGAQALLNQPWLGMPTFSKAHYTDEKRILVTTYGERYTIGGGNVGFTENIPNHDVLVWFDLMAEVSIDALPKDSEDISETRNEQINEALGTGFGFISMTGETLSAASPDFSHDGTKIVYTAASKTQDGRIGGGISQTDVDIHIVPYNDGEGGTVSCIKGACEKEAAEYYPAFSPDDRLIAFNKEEQFRSVKTVKSKFKELSIDGAQADVYYRPHAEIHFIPTVGGTPIRLTANDPPKCTGETSPGIINSRPKWSPSVQTNSVDFGSPRSFYWLVFSSARSYPEQFIVEANQYSPQDTRSSQLYMAAVVRNEATGEYVTYPAVYLWNQEKNTSNLTPAWDELTAP